MPFLHGLELLKERTLCDIGSLAADFAGNEFVYWIGEYTIV